MKMDIRVELYDFLKLSSLDQHKKVMEEGQQIHMKLIKGRVHELYALGLFFVDIRYGLKGLEQITAFHCGHLLSIHIELNLQDRI